MYICVGELFTLFVQTEIVPATAWYNSLSHAHIFISYVCWRIWVDAEVLCLIKTETLRNDLPDKQLITIDLLLFIIYGTFNKIKIK